MARIRSIKPEFWSDEKLGPLDPLTRLVFLGLVGMADDLGRVHDNLKAIDAFIFPFTGDSSRDSLDTLASLGVIRRGISANGKQILELVNWTKHQRIDKPGYRNALPGIAESVGENSRDSRDTPEIISGDAGNKSGADREGDRDRERDREREWEAPRSRVARQIAEHLPCAYHSTLDAFLRGSHNPDALLGSLLMIPERIPGATWDHIGQAMTDLSMAGKQPTGKLLLAFTRGAMTGNGAAPGGDRHAANMAAIAEGIRSVEEKGLLR